MDRSALPGFGGFDRRTVLLAGGGLLGAALVGLSAPAASAEPARLKGIGLTTAEFQNLYGAPRPGQGGFVYDVGNDTFYVTKNPAIPIDRVMSVYWGTGYSGVGTPDGTLPFDDVRNRLAQFLPDDAVLTEVGEAPAAGIGPRLRVDVYNSPLLGSVLRGSGFVDSGDLLAAYTYDPENRAISWANLYVAVKS